MVEGDSNSGAANSSPLMNWLDTSPGSVNTPGRSRPKMVRPSAACSNFRPCFSNRAR